MRPVIDASRALQRLKGLEKQAVFAAGQAANETAKQVQAQMRSLLDDRLDQPGRWTLNSSFIRFARRGETVATIAFREFAGKGTPANKYLQPLVGGGMRRLKRFERALQAKGLLPRGMMTVGGTAFVNAAGNLPPALIVRMLSATGAFSEQGYVANRTKKPGKRKREEFFVRKTKWAGKPPGIWMRPKGKKGPAKPVVIFTSDRQSYRAILPWYETAQRLTAAEYPRQYRLALAKALRTARF